jgi:TRAP-type C4-dicarboxylate transport system substrate-binding protein
MNEDKWNKIAKQDQAIIDKHAYEYAARSNGKSWDAADKVGLDALKAAGANIITADAGMQAEAKKRSGRSSRTGSRRRASSCPTPRRCSTSSTAS